MITTNDLISVIQKIKLVMPTVKFCLINLNDATFCFSIIKYEEHGDVLYLEGKEITGLLTEIFLNKVLFTEDLFYSKLEDISKWSIKTSYQNSLIIV